MTATKLDENQKSLMHFAIIIKFVKCLDIKPVKINKDSSFDKKNLKYVNLMAMECEDSMAKYGEVNFNEIHKLYTLATVTHEKARELHTYFMNFASILETNAIIRNKGGTSNTLNVIMQFI